MRLLRPLCLAALGLPLAACGTYIPSQRDWPNSEPRLVNDMNSVLARSILCELSYAVTLAVYNDRTLAPKRKSRRAYSAFLDHWGVEVATDLTVSESSTFNPTASWLPHSPASAVFTLGGGVSRGSTASNENKYNVFYTVRDLYKPNLFPPDSVVRPCRDPSGNKEGSPLVDIDLQILPLLESRIQIAVLHLANAPAVTETIKGEKNVLTQTVSIKESMSGDITPSWKFTTSNVNPSGKFFSAGRDRTHQIVFTFGRLADDRLSLSPLAEIVHQTQQLKAGFRDIQFVQ